jgi:hypothetical protein
VALGLTVGRFALAYGGATTPINIGLIEGTVRSPKNTYLDLQGQETPGRLFKVFLKLL